MRVSEAAVRQEMHEELRRMRDEWANEIETWTEENYDVCYITQKNKTIKNKAQKKLTW